MSEDVDTATTASPRTAQPLKPFMPEIAEKVLKPYIKTSIEAARTISENEGKPLTTTLIHNHFKEVTGSIVSKSTFNDWMELCGFTVKRSVSIVGG